MSAKQVIVIRKDLNMRKGKIAAQASHASMAAILNIGHFSEDRKFTIDLIDKDPVYEWLTGPFKKICVYVNSEKELLDVHEKAKGAGLTCALIQDNGLTEFNGVKTYTAVAVGPDHDERVNEITGNLPLY